VKATVLDAGALVALERNDRSVWGALRSAASRGRDVLVPTTALAQVWRKRRFRGALAHALQHCVLSPFDGLAQRVGELCGEANTNDICDAHVALVTAFHGDVLYTSDPVDMGRLLRAIGGRVAVVVSC
jgi:hypothetical protein